jgi:hypothetical protein
MSLSELKKKYDLRIERLEADSNDLGRFFASVDNHFDAEVGADYMSAVEWMLRHYQASKHLLGATLFFAQTLHLNGTALSNLASYTAYYSIHHALSAVFVLFPQKTFAQVTRISHAASRNWLQEELVRRKIFPQKSLDAFDAALLAREGFSYRIPLSSNPGGEESSRFLEKAVSSMDQLVPALAQFGNLLSFATHEASVRKFGDIKDEYHAHQGDVDTLFFSMLQISGRTESDFLIDDDDYSRAGYVIRKRSIAPLRWFVEDKLMEDIECGWWEQSGDDDFDVTEARRLLDTWLW